MTEKIYDTAVELFDKLWNHSPIRLIGVSTSRAGTDRYEQYNLFDMDKYEKLGKLNQAIDTIRDRYGEDSIKRACFIDSETEHMSGGLGRAKRAERSLQHGHR